MMSSATTDHSVQLLGEAFSGTVLAPGDPGYDEARRIHNRLIDKRPAVIARCLHTADVVDAVNVGRDGGARGLCPRRRPQRCRQGGHGRGADDRPVAHEGHPRRPGATDRPRAGRRQGR